MSLRLRLTLWSTLLLAAFLLISAVLTAFSVKYLLVQGVDQNLDRQTTATLSYVRWQQSINKAASENRIDTIFYTLLDTDGNILDADRPIPINADYFIRALDGEVVVDTQRLPDGGQVRVMLKAIKSAQTGETLGVLQAATPLAFADQIVDEITLILVISSVSLLIIGAFGSYMLTGRAFRAVGAINRKVRQIELSQDLSQRIPEPPVQDELGNLAHTFNGLLARLESAFDTQRRFVADSSHELRTPLTVIKSNLHLIRQTTDPVERADLLAVTEGEVSRLNRMVNDLLYMAQMQAGHDLKPVLRPVELDSLLLDVFARARPLAQLKKQKITLIHEDISATMGDRDQLHHLLLNLLDNAIKYTCEGGRITLGLWNDKEWARIEVSDNGPGIAEEDIDHIFDRFFRTSDARLNQRSGSGLGLAIVKSITEAHGGRIEVYSRPEEGTTFRLWLRLIDAPQAPDLDDEDELEVPEESALVATE
jgi:two-component system OmpR family sensor kinase